MALIMQFVQRIGEKQRRKWHFVRSATVEWQWLDEMPGGKYTIDLKSINPHVEILIWFEQAQDWCLYKLTWHSAKPP